MYTHPWGCPFAALLLIALAACRDDSISSLDSPRAETRKLTFAPFLVVSDPVARQPDDIDANGSQVAFVSMKPSSADHDVETVRLIGPGSERTISMHEGGFDPQMLFARVGDTICAETFSGTLRVATLFNIVPARQPLKIVRIVPNELSPEVKLAARVQIVFSEPVSAGTLDTSRIRQKSGSRRLIRYIAEPPTRFPLQAPSPICPATHYYKRSRR